MADALKNDEADDLFASALQSPLTDVDISSTGGGGVDNDVAATTAVSASDVETLPPLQHVDDTTGGHEDGAAVAAATAAATNDASLSSHGESGAPQLHPSSQQQQLYVNGRNNAASVQSDGEEMQYLEIDVTQPVKIGDGMSSYMAYKVTTKTNVPGFKSEHFSVMRRFSDFLGLHDKLAFKHVRLGRIVPPAPEKSVIGTTKVKMSHSSSLGGVSSAGGGPLSTASGGSDSSSTAATQCDDFIERRRHALERYLRRSVRHSVLRDDADLREFLELDAELPRATQTSALSSAGVLRLLNRVGEQVNKMAFKMDELDTWFEERVQQVDALESQLRKLHASVEALAAYRRDLAHNTGQFARAAAALSNVEEHTALSRALSQLAELQERVQRLHEIQADNDFYLLAEMLKDYIMLLGAVKDVFHEREKAFQTWQHAVQVLNKKRDARARLELQQTARPDRLSAASEEVADWERKSERSQDEFERVSRCIKKEMETFNATRIDDFKQAFIKHLETLMAHQQKLANQWELFLPEVKAIP